MKKRSLLILAVLFLTACSGALGNGAVVVEQYFTALAEKDVDQVVALSCAIWEESARMDADTFSLYPVTAENISCKVSGTEGDVTIVDCTGKLILDYNGDLEEINLADRSYIVVQGGGEWRMCGYK